ncbi:Prostaglandin E synthase [Chelonia mydas]|uniref:Prostaglandin E synthase n=1 Tax=Chelonia mydas TaxID=8469 RepID=M7B9N5_CHEMY|nr:Prostaglandin E synthase [Chelonia mydas]
MSSSAQVTTQSQNRKRAPAWTEWETLNLIAVWGVKSMLSKLCSKRQNAKIFEKISQGMMDRGHNRDPQQCHLKIKELRHAYQKTKEANGRSGSDPQTCRFYDELHAILGGAPTTAPPLYVDSCQGGVSHNRDEDFGDEEDDEEAEDETILSDSQEPFITLEPIPSQPGLLDHEGREGTSESISELRSLVAAACLRKRKSSPTFPENDGKRSLCIVYFLQHDLDYKNAFANPEDALRNGGLQYYREDPDVERCRRQVLAHRNDMENIFPFLFLGAIYSLLDPNLIVARIHFLIFCVGRIVHTVAYLLRLKAPTRSVAYSVAQLPCFSMALQILFAVVTHW